jgi:N-sulfoglucosamine sulfohydrolase
MFFLAGGCATLPRWAGGEDRRPNIVIIVADDMNWDDTAVYGHPTLKTPNIARLAAGGMTFQHAYLTAASCSPSRSSILTGRYPHNTDAPQLHWPVPAHQTTFVQKLKASGYWCGSAGKWHLGPHVESHFDWIKKADVSGFILPTGKKGSTAKPKMVARDASGCSDWIPTLRARAKDKPFFLWLAALDPHRSYEKNILKAPTKPSEIRLPPYMPDTPEVRGDFAQYYDEIKRLDSYIGKVLDELDAQGVADNTMVLFISDNGRPFPREKTTLYDGGIRTPWIVRWPKRVQAGSSSKSLISSIDIAPTVLSMAGLAGGPTFEGRNFEPMLSDPTASIRKYAFAEDHWHDFEDHGRAVTDGRFKYIRNDYPDLPNTPPADAGRSPTFQTMLKLKAAGKLTASQLACFAKPRAKYEFYDLKSDPHEMKNLVADPAYAKVVAAHRKALADWAQRTNDFIPSKRTPDEFHRVTGQPTPARIRPRPSKFDMFKKHGKY